MAGKRPSGLLAFTVIWLGQLLSTLGTRMTNFALSIWIWQETNRASDLALMMFVAFSATVLCSPLAGTLIDRWDRRLTVVLSDAGSAVATLLLLGLFLTGSAEFWHLLVVNALTGAFLAFQFPAYSSTISLMMEKEHYPRANAMLSLVRSVPAIFAPALAAGLLTLTSIEVILLLDAVSFMLAIGTVFLVTIPQVPPREQEKTSVWKDSLFGLSYIVRRPGLFGLQGILFAISLFAAMGWILLTPIIMARTGNSEEQVGLVQSLGAVGGVLGGLALGALKPTRQKMIRLLWAIVVFSLFGRILLGLGDSLVIWAAAWTCAWLCIPFIDGYGQAIWQEKVEPAVQGRVFAARQLIENLSMPIALGAAGPLADFYFEPQMKPGGSLEPIFGGLVGTGPGAGMAVIFVLTGLLGILVAAAGFSVRSIREVELLIPDHDAPVSEPALVRG